MNKETIEVERNLQWQLFDYWSGKYRHTHADH